MLRLEKRRVIGIGCATFTDCSISAQLKQIANKLEPLQSLVTPFFEKPEFWLAVITSLVTFLAVIVALFNEPIKRWWKKSNLKPGEIKSHNQKQTSGTSTLTYSGSASDGTCSSNSSTSTVPLSGAVLPQDINLIVYRLSIKNCPKHRIFSTSKAEDVEVFVESIFEDDKPRENFLPSPLTWTHGQAYEQNKYLVLRDVHPGQTVWIDICNFIKSSNSLILATSVAAALQIPDFCKLNQGETTLKLSVYQDDGQIVPITILIKWDGKYDPNISIKKD